MSTCNFRVTLLNRLSQLESLPKRGDLLLQNLSLAFDQLRLISHVQPKNVRYSNQPVRLLIVLADRDQHPRYRTGRAVHRVHELMDERLVRLVVRFQVPVLDVEASALKIRAIRRGRDLSVQVTSGQPAFDVIFTGGRVTW